MKAAEARKLIGKPVVWMDTYCAKRGYFQREGVLLAVKGRNVCIDQFGSNDWKWLPDLVGFKEKDAE